MHCEAMFDLSSRAKKEAGGKINECADCVEELKTETAVKYLGMPGDAETGEAINIISFKSDEDRAAYFRNAESLDNNGNR